MASSPEHQANLATSDQNKENIGINKDGDSAVFIDPCQTVDGIQDTRSETQSPRRMKDIHLDGNVDDMRNVNPYLLDDRDLDIRSDVGGVAGSMSSLMSGRSSTVKSANSSRRLKIKSAGTPIPRSNAGSRARQLKDHEGSPFLSIGTPQETTAFSPEIIKGKLSRSSYRGSRHSSLLSVSTAGLTSSSVKSSIEMTPSARNQRSKLFSSNSMVPPSQRTPGPNHSVKMPFKHSVKKPDMNISSSNPSNAMKDRTATATHTLNKLLHAQKPTHTTYVQGRLLKARLKPLEPVKITTPTIHQCRGIVAETRQYGQSESRTFQRWRSIMAGNHHLPTSKSMDMRDGASTCESVHQTSQASTPEPGVDFPTFDIVDNGDFDDVDWAEELGGPIDDNGVPQSIEAPPPFSVPNSRCAPAHCDEDLSHLGGPAMTPVTNTGQGHATPSMMMSSSALPGGFEQQALRNEHVMKAEEEASNGGLGMSDTLGETTTVASSDVGQSNTGVVLLATSVIKRPHSAVYHQENSAAALKESRLAGRPRTAVDGSRKAVRFADESSDGNSMGRKGSMETDLFDKDEETGRKRGGNKNGKGQGKSSCRPRSLDSGFDDRDDKDDDDGVGGGGAGKGRTFLTQGFVGGGGAQANSQQQRGGRSSAQGNTGKQNTFKSEGKSIPNSSNEKMNLELETPDVSSSSCLSATIFYASPDENLTKQKLPKDQKSGFILQKTKGNKKEKTPRDNTKSVEPGSRKETDSTVLPQNISVAEGESSNKNEKDQSGKGCTLAKSLLCKQESSDSGISDSIKDEENCGTESQTNISESQRPSSVVTIAARTIRPTSSSMKRMKAYKTLVAKSKTGNLRPYSGSVYSDVEIQDRKMTNKQRKNIRPASAVSNASCSDILQIQGKYGLYAGAKTAKSVSATPKSCTSFSSSSSSKSVKGDKPLNSYSVSAESDSLADFDNESILARQESQFSDKNMLQVERSLHDENYTSSMRPKSSSKVTFAAEDEYEDDRSSRKSTVTSAKSTSRASSILRGSSTGYTHIKGGKHGNDMVDDIDYDQMWAELPDDNSDAEKSLDDGEDDDNDDDNFMSKFDLLQNQFDAVAAEFESERSKLSTTSKSSQLVPYNASCNDDEKSTDKESCEPLRSQNTLGTATGHRQNEIEYSYSGDVFVSEEEMAMIRESGYRIESDNGIFVTDNSTFDDHDQFVVKSGNENSNASFCNESENEYLRDERKTDSLSQRPEFLNYEEPRWKENGWVCAEISQNLYKSTNRYVEVKTKDKDRVGPRDDNKDCKKTSSSVASRIDHGQKKISNLRGSKQGKSKADEDDKNLNGEYKKSVYKMETDGERPNSVHIVIPGLDDYGFGFSCEGTAKPKSHRALSSRAATPVAARKLSKSKNGNDNESMDSKYSNIGKNKDGDLCIDANSCNIMESRATPTPIPRESYVRNTARDDVSNKNSLNSQKTGTVSDSCVSSKESEATTVREVGERTNNYYDLLLAYRSHCMEDSDDENDDESGDDNNNAFTDSGEIRNHSPDENLKEKDFELYVRHENDLRLVSQNDGHRVDNETPEVNPDNLNDNDGGKTAVETEVSQKNVASRPVSAVTTDSGLETDSHADDTSNQSLTLSRPDSGVSSSDNRSQLQSRPDSGVSSDVGMDKQSKDESAQLEIIASSKNLIKQRPPSASDRRGSHSTENMEKLSSLPPLCFQLNARPPSGFLYYFAYGPNMNSDRISCYLGCEKSPPRFWGLLFGFGLVFNMKGTSSNSDQVGGLPNLEWNPGMSVEGCVYQITHQQLDRLDKFVGYPKTVEHVVLPVWMSNSLDPDELGVAQYCVPALTFIARDAFTWKEPVSPSDYSISQCVKSADLVTPEFKGHLASFSSNNQVALVAAS